MCLFCCDNVYTICTEQMMTTDLECERVCGYDSDSLARNHTDKLICLFSAAFAKYLDQLHLLPYKNMHAH